MIGEGHGSGERQGKRGKVGEKKGWGDEKSRERDRGGARLKGLGGRRRRRGNGERGKGMFEGIWRSGEEGNEDRKK